MSMAEATQGKAHHQRSSSTLTNVGRLVGAIGMVLLVSTPLTWLLTGEAGALVWGKLLLGVLASGFYVATNADVFTRVAGSRSTGLLAMTAASVVIVIGLLGVANYIAYKNPKTVDLTREGLYTLSKQTSDVLGRLKKNVKIYAFYSSEEPNFATVQETLGRYQKASAGKLTFEMVNPQSRPDLVEKYNITESGPRLVIAAGEQDARAKDVSEEELTNGLVKVAEQTSKTIYFLTGHGEPSIEQAESAEGYKSLAEAIRAEGYEVKTLNLLKATAAAEGAKVKVEPAAEKVGETPAQPSAADTDNKLEVPAEVSVLIVAGAHSNLLPPEIAALEAYVQKGGRIIVMLEPDSDYGLDNFLRQWKIEAHKDLVVDTNPMNRLLGLGPASPMVQPTEEEHPITRDLAAPVVLASARSLAVSSGGLKGVDAKPLLEAGESAWGETNLEDGTAAKDDHDNLGPLPVAIVATKKISDPVQLTDEGRVVAFGDSEWVNNKYLAVQSNNDVILNTVNWMAEEQARITIRPKNRKATRLFLSGEQVGQLKFFTMDILPVLIVAMGLGVVLIRRQR